VTTRDDPDRLAILVHEVRSPVAALAAIGDATASDGLAPAELRELVALSLAACRVIERLVSDAAMASVRLEEVDASRLVREAVASATIGGARVRAVVAPELPRIRVDPLRVRQALDNLVSNALVHGSVDDEVVVRAAVGSGEVLLSVTDAGEGIRVEDQPRIFDSGVRLDAGGSGAGLGLAIARAIAEAHGGTLGVESTPGKGATFTIALPVA
jgi:two-component system, OmpR family, sensor histidine kinase BaeS